MTNSMIPYSFIPGTKAKAGEVNANFIALASAINQNKEIAQESVSETKEQIIDLLKDKADKTEVITDHTVSTAQTDLNNYKTSGTYIFSSLYTPLNIPKGESGTLIVTGKEESVIKQIWYCDGANEEIFIRSYQNSAWTEWNSNVGDSKFENPGYLKFPNGLLIQWCNANSAKTVVYPVAFSTIACPFVTKHGYAGDYQRSDSGFTAQSLTGFTYSTVGKYSSLNWIAIGY